LPLTDSAAPTIDEQKEVGTPDGTPAIRRAVDAVELAQATLKVRLLIEGAVSTAHAVSPQNHALDEYSSAEAARRLGATIRPHH